MSVSTQFDLAAAATVMKELYDGQTVENMVYSDNPFWALIPKKTNFVGKVYPSPVEYGTAQGRSATFATAQANQTAALSVEFMLKRAKDYAVYGIDNETMMASASDKGSFVEGIKFQADSAWRAIENSLATSLFGSGTGSIGSIGTISSGVITLSNPGDVVKFEVNQAIQANATDGGTPRAAVGYVISVNSSFSGATVTVSTSLGGAAGTPGSWAAGDFLVTQGDNNLKLTGLAGWFPATAPTTGDSFFGVDRSVHPTRLAGLRYPDVGQSIEEAIIDAAAYTAREGGRPNYGITNPISFAALEKSLGSKVQYVDLKAGSDGTIGFRGIQVNAPGGVINVMSDRSCQAKQMWLLTMRTLELKSLGAAPQILNYGDGNMLRISNQDAAEGRIGFYGNMRCSAPGYNCNLGLGA